jgi:hypothetical protein
MCSRVRIVVGAVRAGVAPGDAQIGEQERHRFGGHGRTTNGVDREADLVLCAEHAIYVSTHHSISWCDRRARFLTLPL